MVKPISPKDAIIAKKFIIPDTVIELFNKLIIENFDGFRARVLQKDIIKLIIEKLKIKREQIFELKYLDVEPIFRNAGWEVNYEGQSYGDDFDSYYIFAKPK